MEALVATIFQRIAAGSTPGEVARRLNAAGHTTIRGKRFRPRAVREIVLNDIYVGRRGYLRIVSDELFTSAGKSLTRMDPAAVQRRAGGRPPKDDSYILRGFSFCSGCGAPMWISRNYLGGRRAYVCREVQQCTGLCHRPAVLAEAAEVHVLNHLQTFVGSVEGWIKDRLQERAGERTAREKALVLLRTALADLDRKREQRIAELATVSLTDIALEVIAKIDQDREDLGRQIAEAEAVLAEWAVPDVDEALDYYNQLVDLIQGKVATARGALELNRALAQVLAGLWMEFERDRDRLLVEFVLRGEPRIRLLGGVEPIFAAPRMSLPPARAGYQPIAPFEPSHSHR